MKFNCFSKWDQLPQSSDLLFDESEKHSLFFSRTWFENLVATSLKNDESMLIVCVVEDAIHDSSSTKSTAKSDKVLAILPLISRNNKQWTSLFHVYTSLYSLLLVKDNQQEIINCMAEGLRQLPFDSLTLEPLANDDHNINNLELALESSGFSCSRYARFFNWYHQLQGQTFTDYMETRPSKVRNTINRKQKKLEREHQYEIRLHKGDDVQQAMTDFNAVYKASWKRDEQFADVMEGFTYRFSKLAWTRLAILYIEGEPVATQLWFVVHKKASIFKLAYDETWKQYSPGSILTKYLMEYVIDTDKVDEIDFLTGNDHYKQDWMSHRRQRWNLKCTRKPEPDKKESRHLKRIKNWLKKS